MRHVLLDEVLVVGRDRHVEAPTRGDPAVGERILVGMTERHELVVVLEVREVEARHPPHHLVRCVAGPAQLLGERRELGAGRDAVEAADPHVHGVDLTAAEQGDDGVAGFFEIEAATDRLAVVHAPYGPRPDSRGNPGRAAW